MDPFKRILFEFYPEGFPDLVFNYQYIHAQGTYDPVSDTVTFALPAINEGYASAFYYTQTGDVIEDYKAITFSSPAIIDALNTVLAPHLNGANIIFMNPDFTIDEFKVGRSTGTGVDWIDLATIYTAVENHLRQFFIIPNNMHVNIDNFGDSGEERVCHIGGIDMRYVFPPEIEPTYFYGGVYTGVLMSLIPYAATETITPEIKTVQCNNLTPAGKMATFMEYIHGKEY